MATLWPHCHDQCDFYPSHTPRFLSRRPSPVLIATSKEENAAKLHAGLRDAWAAERWNGGQLGVGVEVQVKGYGRDSGRSWDHAIAGGHQHGEGGAVPWVSQDCAPHDPNPYTLRSPCVSPAASPCFVPCARQRLLRQVEDQSQYAKQQRKAQSEGQGLGSDGRGDSSA